MRINYHNAKEFSDFVGGVVGFASKNQPDYCLKISIINQDAPDSLEVSVKLNDDTAHCLIHFTSESQKASTLEWIEVVNEYYPFKEQRV